MRGVIATGVVLVSAVCAAAVPVWPEGEEATLNSFFDFRADFAAKAGDDVVLRVTAGYDYKARLNGAFVGFGPCRTAPGFFRVDEWKLSAKAGTNVLSIESAGYNCNSFYLCVQKPFLMAEVLVNGKAVAATGADGAFKAYRTGRVRKAPRHSYQRTFSEIYRLPVPEGEPVRLAAQEAEGRKLLPREWDYPDFRVVPMVPLSRETVAYDATVKVRTPRCIASDQENYIRFPQEELEENPYAEMQRWKAVSRSAAPTAADGWYPLDERNGIVFAADRIHGGFAGVKVRTKGSVSVYITFDEVLQKDGSVNFVRTDTLGTLTWHLERAGEYELETFEPYGFKYARVLVLGGGAEISAPWIRNYESPSADRAKFACSDKGLERIFEAGRASYRANAVDCFNDCPNRERGGWLGDTFFTGKASRYLTGSGRNERLFLKNFLLPESFRGPKRYEGLVPAVWPCDPDMCREVWIPTYCMWLIKELEECVTKNGSREFAEAFRPRVLAMIDSLDRYVNDYGLLQHLPGWVFVEWSHANLLPYDVNYPSNMLYADALDAVARMYGLPEFAARAKTLREKVVKQSFRDGWFCDNAVVKDECGGLGLSGERTEVCQYYAFFTGTATPESHPDLYRRLMDEFGPNRVSEGRYKEIWPANFFFGTCLRMELLSRAGRTKQMRKELRDYFLYMADMTGTLWENQTPNASCCHGFASIGALYMLRDVLGVRDFDPVAKTVTVRPAEDLGLDWCEGTVPVSETETAFVRWERSSGKLRLDVRPPDGWRVIR